MKNEIRKILKFPVFWVMISICLTINIAVISQLSHVGNEIRLINDYVKTGDILFEDSYGFCQAHKKAKETAYETYYENLDIKELVNNVISAFTVKPDENAMKIIAYNYEKAEKRIEEIKADGEANEETYSGEMFELHYNMYQVILLVMLLEISTVAVVMTSYIMKYEENFSTSQILYVSKTGRGLAKTKVFSCALVAGITAFITETLTYAVFFIRVPHRLGFLNSSVSSAMSSEYRGIYTGIYPLITWVKMSSLQYLICVILLSIFIAVFMSLLTSAVSFISKNAYINILLSVIILFALFASAICLDTGSVLKFVVVFNPTMVIYLCYSWFMECANTIYNSYQGYETLVILVYLILFFIITKLSYKHFKKKDIC